MCHNLAWNHANFENLRTSGFLKLMHLRLSNSPKRERVQFSSAPTVHTAHSRILYMHTSRHTCTVPVMTMQWCCGAAEWRRLGHVIRSDEGCVRGPSHSWHSWQCLTRHRVTWPPTLIVTQLSHFTLGKIAHSGYYQTSVENKILAVSPEILKRHNW